MCYNNYANEYFSNSLDQGQLYLVQEEGDMIWDDNKKLIRK